MRLITQCFALFLLAVLGGCASSQPLYVNDNGVSVYLESEPTISNDSFEIKLHFETNAKSKHVIQQIESGGWLGIESFRLFSGSTTTDTHTMTNSSANRRRMTLIPGEVSGADEGFFSGFAMLPSAWPSGWNEAFRKSHQIQGQIVALKPEFTTIYHIEFSNGKLILYVEGSSIRREWTTR